MVVKRKMTEEGEDMKKVEEEMGNRWSLARLLTRITSRS